MEIKALIQAELDTFSEKQLKQLYRIIKNLKQETTKSIRDQEQLKNFWEEDQVGNTLRKDQSPRTPGLLSGKLGDAFFEPLPEDELQQWE